MTADRQALSPAARVVLAGSAVSALGTGMVLPFLLIYLHAVRGIPLTTTGLLLALPGLVGFVAGPLGGIASDRLGAQPTLVAGMAAAAAGSLLLTQVRTAAVAIPVLLLLGIGNASFFSSQSGLFARLADGLALQRLFAVNFVLLNAGIGIGGVIAGALVSVHHVGSFQLVYLADGVTTFALRRRGRRPSGYTARGSSRTPTAAPTARCCATRCSGGSSCSRPAGARRLHAGRLGPARRSRPSCCGCRRAPSPRRSWSTPP